MEVGERDGPGTRFATRMLINQEGFAGSARLTGKSSQSRGLRLAARNCDVCSVHTWRLEISKRALLHFLRETKYRRLCMLLIRSW